MNIQLEPGDLITITTDHGAIVVNTDAETGATLVTVAHTSGYKLAPKLAKNSQTGQQDAQVWIEPAGGL